MHPSTDLFHQALQRSTRPAYGVTHARPIVARDVHLEARNDDRGDLTNEELADIDREFGITHKTQHLLTRERDGGTGPNEGTRVNCACGWRGPWRYEYQSDRCALLGDDERGHAS